MEQTMRQAERDALLTLSALNAVEIDLLPWQPVLVNGASMWVVGLVTSRVS